MKTVRQFTTVVFGVALCCALSTAAFASDYSVQKGDCLWRIARRTLGSGLRWSEIYEANRDQIKNPHWIYPNQVFVIPDGMDDAAPEEPEAPAAEEETGAVAAEPVEAVPEPAESDEPETDAPAPQAETGAAEPAAKPETADADETGAAGTLSLYGTPVDYEDATNWIARSATGKVEDVFYLAGNSYVFGGGSSEREICTIFNQGMRSAAQSDYSSNASAFLNTYNVFAPFYRQAGVRSASETPDSALLLRTPRTDVYAALDYYFENLNDGRPVRFEAGHGQGEALLTLILDEYMPLHPDYAALLTE